MLKNAKQEFVDAVRTEAEKRATEGRQELERRADEGRRELGTVMVDLTEEYFPEAVRRRRRRDVAGGFLAGAVAGYVIRHLLRD